MSRSSAADVDDDRKGAARAQRTDPTDHVAGRPLRLGRVGHDRATTTDGVGQALQIELAIDRHDREDEPPVDGCGERLVHPFGLDTERGRRIGAVGRTTVAVPSVAVGRLVFVDAVRHAGPSDRRRARGFLLRPRPDASDFGYARGGPSPSASIDARPRAAVALLIGARGGNRFQERL